VRGTPLTAVDATWQRAQVLAASSLQDLPHGGVDVVTALPNIVSNLHDYFISVAAKLDRVHTAVRGTNGRWRFW
jgi:hypothetical protein